MPALLEQLLIQLQSFPEPPLSYRPQINEPLLVSQSRIRILTGFSGAGKTAWASQAALHCPQPLVYYDVGNMPAESAASALARELTARFLGRQGGAVLAESVGINILRACARRLEQENIDVTVVLDNAHRFAASTLIAIVEAAPNLKFLLIAQPWSDQALIEARLQIRAEQLEGWSQDDIAAEGNVQNCRVSQEAARRIRHLTGGLPLYVQGAITIIMSSYNGDAELFCDAIEAQTHAEDTPQEIILQQVFDQLTENAQRAAAVLSLCDIALTNDEVLTVVNVAISTPTGAARSLRELKRNSMLINFQGGQVTLHDALRPLATAARSLLTSELEQAILVRLYEVLRESLANDRSIPRLNLIFRLLPQIGQTETLVDIATHEMFHEQGDQRVLRIELENAANNETSSIRDRYWAHDALAYWESRDGGRPSAERLAEMRRLVEEGSLGEREQIGLCFKEIAAASDRQALERAYSCGKELTRQGTESRRMLRYNYAVMLNRFRIFDSVISILDPLIAEYFQFFGIQEEALFMASNMQVRDMLPQPLDLENIKHLGDALSLWSHARVGLDQPPMFRRIHAMKFYTVAQAGRSAVSAGMECVDDFLVIMADAIGARQIMETHVLPLVEHFHLTDLILETRSIYAIVLAWNGEIGNARQELRALGEYLHNPEQTEMLANRSRHVEDIASRRFRLERQRPPSNALSMILNASQPQIRSASGRRAGRAPGRNEPCPCGSGQKYKRCHGK
ncbi:MAG: SEC-C domain-containing protein [Alphaproteobacteria bacterium]|nr:SEC-C domain-containing protein [Alphaproteobacteria bacterium]